MAGRLTRLFAVLLAGLPLACAATGKNGFRIDDALIPADQIQSGGPPRDGIPSLDNPAFVNADQATFLQDRDRVLGIAFDGVTRAYPIRILNYHEIVNDTLNGRAIVITWCPLCGSGMAFSATLDGQKIEFGVSGLLYNSDVLMYDRQTESLWSQLKSMAVTAPIPTRTTGAAANSISRSPRPATGTGARNRSWGWRSTNGSKAIRSPNSLTDRPDSPTSFRAATSMYCSMRPTAPRAFSTPETGRYALTRMNLATSHRARQSTAGIRVPARAPTSSTPASSPCAR